MKSVSRDVWQPFGDPVDRLACLQEGTRRVPGASHELMVVGIREPGWDGAITELYHSMLHVEHDLLFGIAGDGLHQPSDVLRCQGETGQAEGDAVADEDLRKRLPDQPSDPPAAQTLRGVLPGRA